MSLRVGQYVRFKDNPACTGVIFEFQDDGMVGGLKSLSDKLKSMMGGPDETHEPVENLEVVPQSNGLAVGDVVQFVSDGPAFSGTIFEFQDEGAVAGLKSLSDKLKGLMGGGCVSVVLSPFLYPLLPFLSRSSHDHALFFSCARSEETHEPTENLAPVG